MQKYNYDTAVFIGRFNPFHKGHEMIIREGLKIAKEVVVVVGSSFAPPTLRNPFTYEQRRAMIMEVFSPDRVKVVPVMDYPYNDTKWLTAVKSAVNASRAWSADPVKTVLIGYGKDESSYYLNMFPSWDSMDLGGFKQGDVIVNATDIREKLYNPGQNGYFVPQLNLKVLSYINSTVPQDQFTTLFDEYEMVKDYKKQFESMPYPPTFVTVDAVVTQSDKILLVKRGAMPGKGLWALPGGFLDQNETLLDGAIRELREETRLKVPEKVLKGSIKSTNTFDDPHRSSRGRTLTTAFHIDLGMDSHLPKIKGSDDAVDAQWVDIDKVDSRKMFEDHFGIIDYFLNIA